MTEVATGSTDLKGRDAGCDLAAQILEQLGSERPDAVIVFASSDNDYEGLLTEMQQRCGAKAMVGCSSAGEFTGDSAGTNRTSVLALRAPEMRFTASMARDLSQDRPAAARQLVSRFTGLDSSEFRYRTALLLVDALAGHTEDLVDQMTIATGGMYQFVGGGAGDNAQFKQTHVLFGTSAFSNAAVALEILSNKPIGIGARHGWSPSGDPLRVTESAESCVVSLNVSPAVEAFDDHAAATEQHFDHDDPLPFFLHNIVGVQTDAGHKLRVPLGIAADGGVLFAAEIPVGVIAHVMSTGATTAAEAAGAATRDAVAQVEQSGHTPKAALFFDCVATRLRLGDDFGKELDTVAKELKTAQFAGFNSYGQIVRAEGQASGFHNCTAVVCVFPD
ncbi:MAG TPA: FIST N-terminal domain-containing protein [Gemmatimonadaceae bacterium]